MTQFSGAEWTVDNATLWTRLFQDGGHPNGTIGSGGKNQVEQWAVRRWISPLSGSLLIEGLIADRFTPGGNGIVARIFLDGSEVFTHTVAANNVTDFNYSFPVTVSAGSIIDFAIDPRNPDDGSDGTKFTAVIIPEPSSALLLSLAAGVMLARRRTRNERNG